MTIIDRRYSVAEGQAIKTPCKAATTANITLGGLQTIDGIALAENDRVLVKNQSTGSQNGIYSASTGNWTRTRDFDGAFDIVTGTRIYITSGSVNAQYEYVVTTADPITIDTTSIAFAATGAASAAASAVSAAASAATSSAILITIAGQIEYETRAVAIAASIPLAAASIRITRYATGLPVSNAVYVPGTVSGPMAFLDAAGHYWQLDYTGGIVNPLWFGATGDQTTNDYTALQAAATAAQTIGGELFLPMMFKTLTAIAITGRISVRGTGYHSSPIDYGYGSTTNAFDTRATGFKGTGLICGIANGAFTVATTDSVSFENFHVTYPTAANVGVTAFLLATAAGNIGVNVSSIIRDVRISSADTAISVTDWLQFNFERIDFVLCTNPIVAENLTTVKINGVTTSADCGDSRIINCNFFITVGAAAIVLLSGSGYRIANNKFFGSNAGLPNATAILIAPQDLGISFNMTPGIIADNSIEGFGYGILFSPAATSQGALSLWSIVGNEIFCTIGIAMSAGVAVPQWISGIVISGNTFTFGQGGSVNACIILAGVNGCLVGDNSFAADSTQTAISIGGSTTTIKIGNNNYLNSTKSGAFITPALPLSGVTIANTTGYTAAVNVYSGTVSSVQVTAVNSGVAATTVAQATNCSVTINPGDLISVGYSVTPTWVWRASNP